MSLGWRREDFNGHIWNKGDVKKEYMESIGLEKKNDMGKLFSTLL